MRPISFGQEPTISHISATSSSVSSRGKLNNTMCCRLIAKHPSVLDEPRASGMPPRGRSVELEVLAHLPVANVLSVSQRALGDRCLVPAVLRLLHLQQVVDQRVAERLAVERVLLQRADAFGERGGEALV